jgi:carbohydrate kinase (thermoresistant glucokinase family)
LDRLRGQITRSLAAKENAVLACSALKRGYRERLRVGEKVKFVFLKGDYATIEKQLGRRRGHFMNPDLLRSQFEDLEEPATDEGTVTIKLDRSPEEVVDEIKAKLVWPITPDNYFL